MLDLLVQKKVAPAAEPAVGDAAEEDDNGYAPEEEAQVEFEPVMKLQEVKTETHEENETVLFKMCAALIPPRRAARVNTRPLAWPGVPNSSDGRATHGRRK